LSRRMYWRAHWRKNPVSHPLSIAMKPNAALARGG
jgi:hypothetical protein